MINLQATHAHHAVSKIAERTESLRVRHKNVVMANALKMQYRLGDHQISPSKPFREAGTYV